MEPVADIQILEQLLKIAPITVIVMIVVGISVWATRKLLNEHISSLKQFIEYLKRGDK